MERLIDCQWDRPLSTRVADDIAAQRRREALATASAEDLRDLAYRLTFAQGLADNKGQYAGHLARLPSLKPIHANAMASIANQVEDAWSEVQGWWSDRCPAPEPKLVERKARIAATDGRFEAPEGTPETSVPCDGLDTPEGYRFLGDTRGTKLPDGSRGTPHALFLRESDLTVWIRARKGKSPGDLVGYSGPAPRIVLGTRGVPSKSAG